MRRIEKIKRVALELQGRVQEAVDLFEPLPVQADFLSDPVREKLFCANNQAGKTMSSAVELALAFMGRHPRLPERDGKAWVIALDGNAIGDVWYKKLFCEGSTFRIIRDKDTLEWRTYKWWLDEDRFAESKWAPPLIPERYIRSIAWENKAAHIPAVVTSTTGWEFRFLSSKGEPERGVQLDIVAMDEECANPLWYSEAMARLLIKRGFFIWSVTPQVGTRKFYDLYYEAKQQEDKENPRIKIFHMELDDNPYMKPEAKADFKEQMKDDELQYLARVKGLPALHGLQVLPEFGLRKELASKRWFPIPQNWTRYAFIDPGFQLCAVLFAAVPPPEDGRGPKTGEIRGDFVYLYDELYVKHCTAVMLAKLMRDKTAGQIIQDFIVDYQGGRARNAIDGRRIVTGYSVAFAEQKVSSVVSGTGFTHAIPDIEAGVEALHEMLRVRDDGTTKLRYFPDKVPNFAWEAENWHNKPKPKKKSRLEPEDRGRVHQVSNCRYMALYKPKWVQPEQRREGSVAYQAFQAKMKRRRELTGGRTRINCGPGPAFIQV